MYNTRSKRSIKNKTEITTKNKRSHNGKKSEKIENCVVTITPLEKSEYKEIYKNELNYLENCDVLLSDPCAVVPNLNDTTTENKPTITFVDIDKIIKQPPVENQQHSTNISRRLLRANKKLFLNKYGKRILPQKSDISKSAIQLQRLDLSKFSKIDSITYSIRKGEFRKSQLNCNSSNQYYLPIPKTTQIRQKARPESLVNSGPKLLRRTTKINEEKHRRKSDRNIVNELNSVSSVKSNSFVDLRYSVNKKADVLKSCQNNIRSKVFVITDDDTQTQQTSTNKNEIEKVLTKTQDKRITTPKNVDENDTVNGKIGKKPTKPCLLGTSFTHSSETTVQEEKSANPKQNHLTEYKLVLEERSHNFKDSKPERQIKQKFNFNDTVYKLCNTKKKVLKLPNSQWQFESNYKPCKNKPTGKNITVSYTLDKKKFTKNLYFDVKNTASERLTFNDIYALKYFSFKRFQFKIKSMNVYRSADRVVDIYRDGTYKIVVDGCVIELCGAPSVIKTFSEIQILLDIVQDCKLNGNYISVAGNKDVD